MHKSYLKFHHSHVLVQRNLILANTLHQFLHLLNPKEAQQLPRFCGSWFQQRYSTKFMHKSLEQISIDQIPEIIIPEAPEA